jgi:amidohydrolase
MHHPNKTEKTGNQQQYLESLTGCNSCYDAKPYFGESNMSAKQIVVLTTLTLLSVCTSADLLKEKADPLIDLVQENVVAWRRDIHEHPELGNREFRTSALIADHLRGLGMEVTTGVGHTGVVGFLRGAADKPVVALRADMDGLPVTERVDLPFASKARSTYRGEEVGVMHACGHDNHVAILMGTAEVLASMRDNIPGSIKFIFQPAEEGAPDGEEGGAETKQSARQSANWHSHLG